MTKDLSMKTGSETLFVLHAFTYIIEDRINIQTKWTTFF
jgi:hypothetical protein